MEENTTFVELTTVSTVMDADYIRMILESNGIDCYLQNEHSLTAMPMHNLAIGGVGVMVPESQREQAQSALQEAGVQISFPDPQQSITTERPAMFHPWFLWLMVGAILLYLVLSWGSAVLYE